MKVIARIDRDICLCEMHHDELEKFRNLYYNKMKRMEIGDEIDLAKGYDFAREISEAVTKIQAFVESAEWVTAALKQGIALSRMRVKALKQEVK